MLVDEFIARNADPLWLHQSEMWELISVAADEENAADVGNYRHSRDSKSSVMEQKTMIETPESQRKDAHAQGFDEVPL